MTLREFKECIEFNIKHNIKHAVLGLGAPGVGKSQVVRQIGKEYGYKVIDIRLAQMSEVEIGGLIYPNEERTKTKWLSPEILPDEERDGKNTILLLDEITSCSKRVQVAAYQLILDRRVGQYTLPEGTFVIALGNREDDDGVYIQLAGPLADRFEIDYIDIDFDSWKKDFAYPNNIFRPIIDYLDVKPSALHNQAESDESMVFATPRSWERVSDILKCDSDISKKVICNKIIGNIGLSEGMQFIEFMKKSRPVIDVDAFIEGRISAPKEPAEFYLLKSALIGKADFIKNYGNVEELGKDERDMAERIIRSCFRLGSDEYTIVTLKGIMELNRKVARDVFLLLDDANIDRFIKDNQFMLQD